MSNDNHKNYEVFHMNSLQGAGFLARHRLTHGDVQKAVALWHEDSKSTIRTVLGINEDGLFGSERDDWHPNLPDAFAETLIHIPWIQILELLQRVPKGTTGEFLEGSSGSKQ